MGQTDKRATPVQPMCKKCLNLVQVLFDHLITFCDVKSDKALNQPFAHCLFFMGGCVKPCLKISKTPSRGRPRRSENIMCSAEKFNLCHECQHPSQWPHRKEKVAS